MVVTCGAAAPFWLRLGIPAFLRSRSVRFHAPHRHTSQPSGLHDLWSLSVISIHSLARGWRYKALYTRLCLRCATDCTPPCLFPLPPGVMPARSSSRSLMAAVWQKSVTNCRKGLAPLTVIPFCFRREGIIGRRWHSIPVCSDFRLR